MRIYESGRESSLLQKIKDKSKTIECRLNRDKFTKYQAGDRVWLREDTYLSGEIVNSRPKQLLIEIEKIENYPTFQDMFEAIDYSKAIPTAKSTNEAVAARRQFYSSAEEQDCGVLAIYFHVIKKATI